MKTLLNSVSNHSKRGNKITAALIIFSLLSISLMASTDEKLDGFIPHVLKGWTICWEGNEIRPGGAVDIESTLTLACKPEVNVSLGQQGYAAITALLLVNAPLYSANEYIIDIMGPLSDTVYCEQLGQELMVVVTDPLGNSCMSTIFIEDKLKPVLVCTSDTLPCNVDIPSIDFESFIDSVTDNCDPDPDLWYSYTIQNLPCNPHGFTQSILVTWTATDASGNSTTCQDVIYLKKPALGQIVFPPNISVSCTNPNIDPSITGEPTFNGEPIGLTCQIVVSYTDQVVPMCNGSRKVLRMWTIMDWCTSGMVNHVQEILIIDNVDPVITCPANITISAGPGLCTANYTFPLPNVTDACSNPNMIDIILIVPGVGIFEPGDVITLGLGVTLITVRATDACLNSSQCQYSVTVRDNTPPVIICPPNTNVDCTGSTDPSNTGSATAFDICDPTPTVTYTDVTVAFPGCAVGYKINRTWKAMDDSGNTACCTQMITLSDNTPPIITCPPNVAISCTESTLPPNTGNATATDQCDLTPIITFSDVTVGGACPQERTINRTWRATDDCGNSSSCIQTISVEDNLAPVITCPPNVSVECESMTIPGFTGTATATDNCDPSATITFTDVSAPSGPQEFTITRTWNASDDCGNSSTCIQLIIVHDETPPVITCPASLTIQCTASTLPGNTGSATATDNCDPAPDITYSDVTVGGACPQELTITRTWVATDDCGNSSTCNQAIFIDDSVPPLISCPGNLTIQCTDSTLPAFTGTATATDNCDAIPFITFSDITVGGLCPQERTITRTWNAIDDCGNSSTCVQTIVVDDSVAPNIACPGNITIECTDSTLPAFTGTATATDNCDAIPTVIFSDVTIAGACAQERTISRTWTATDDCGNNSTCLQTIFVDDSVPPFITCPDDVAIECTDSTLPANTGTATATDNCNGAPIITFNDVTVAGSCPILVSITRTWTASDGCSNTSTCVQFIVVADSQGPSITCPPNVTIECTASTLPANTGVPTTSDNCGPAPPVTFTDVTVGGACPQERTITRTWVATDNCDNTSTCVQTIFVDDSTAPTIDCPDNVTVDCDDDTSPGGTGSATALDNCDTTPSVSFTDLTEGAGCPEGITITRTWVAIDDCGNSSSCIQVILVDDNVAPAITCPVDITIECTDSTDPEDTGEATATDGCDDTPVITFSDVTVGGSCPNLYTITRTWTATDDCGNAGTCNQIILLDDTTAPICEAMDITVSLNGSGFITILPSQIDGGSSDNCGPVDLSLFPDEFNCDSLGENIVVLTVTDCSGNSSTCTAIVTVEDNESLEAICQDIAIILDENGNATIDPASIDNGSGGGCAGGSLDFELSQTDFDCADVGQVIVTLMVTDGMGNTATCTAIVTVIDSQDPTITCPANVTVSCETLTDPDNTGQFGNATASDNCPGVIITEMHVINLNDCNVGTIVRTFTATDASDNIAVCIQIVTVNNPNPLEEEDITWPPSPISVDICNSTLPQNIPNGFPVIDPTALLCSDPIISFVDVVQTIVDNNPATPCKIITRTWTVVDNCQVNATFMFVQTINVQDMVAPVFTNINDMTKVANLLCVANFTLIASATDCAGVSITNNSPYGVNSGSNASGDYPVGVTTVIFTATDGCGNISTMDVVITVTDPNPTDFMCEKTIVFLPEETEITLSARIFVTFIDGGCSDENDYIVSYSKTDPFDTTNVYDCGDVGVTTFPLWFFTAGGTQLIDSCFTADLDLRDPTDFCQDGLVLIGNIEGEEGQAVSGVEVSITNVPMTPDTTNIQGQYALAGLNKGTGYMVVPFNDLDHREGVSTLDLVLIQKHLLGRAKLNSPYKMIAADANKSGGITAIDLIEIRRLILGINSRFPNNTSWRFVDQGYSFIDPFNPFGHPIPESVWLDSISHEVNTVNFVGVKIGDVNGSYFLSQATGSKIEPRFLDEYELEMGIYSHPNSNGSTIEISVPAGQGEIDGFQFGLFVGELTNQQINGIKSEYLLPEEWVYNSQTGILSVSRAMSNAEDISGKIILTIPDVAITKNNFKIESSTITPEVYRVEDDNVEVKRIHLKTVEKFDGLAKEYHLYQNIPNPFVDGTVISFYLPQKETATLVIYDNTGKEVFEFSSMMEAGHNEIPVKATSLRHAGIYYYTLYTANASFTRKMSFTND